MKPTETISVQVLTADGRVTSVAQLTLNGLSAFDIGQRMGILDEATAKVIRQVRDQMACEGEGNRMLFEAGFTAGRTGKSEETSECRLHNVTRANGGGRP